MKPAILAPKGARERKPRHGQPCNRCGLCCMATLCPLAAQVFGREIGPCPALEPMTVFPSGVTEYRCGLTADPMRWRMKAALLHGVKAMREAAAHLIGAGTGCDARFDGEAPDQSFYDRLNEHDRRTRAQTAAAKRLWSVQ